MLYLLIEQTPSRVVCSQISTTGAFFPRRFPTSSLMAFVARGRKKDARQLSGVVCGNVTHASGNTGGATCSAFACLFFDDRPSVSPVGTWKHTQSCVAPAYNEGGGFAPAPWGNAVSRRTASSVGIRRSQFVLPKRKRTKRNMKNLHKDIQKLLRNRQATKFPKHILRTASTVIMR